MIDLHDLEFFDSASKYGVVKATVHKTGKLGFSSGASRLMKLEDVPYMKIAVKRLEEEPAELYLFPVLEEGDKSFKVAKAGEYYSINVKHVMTDLKIDYENESVIYDIEAIETETGVVYKLIKRKKE